MLGILFVFIVCVWLTNFIFTKGAALFLGIASDGVMSFQSWIVVIIIASLLLWSFAED
jgi:hypothetical protein